jgi:EAL domain-containing protein (putative c-di-GMP-specific phosphodiesterase class I)
MNMDVIFPRGSARNLSREMMGDYNGYVIVKAIVGMARDLGLRSVAEGVEDLEQVSALRALGCDQAQGYYFGRPEPADVFAARWLGVARQPS